MCCDDSLPYSKKNRIWKKIRKEYEAGIVKEQIKNIQRLEPREDGKINCLTTVQKNNLIIVSGTIRTFGGKHFREIKSGKSCTLMARARNDGNAQPCVQIGAKLDVLPQPSVHGFKPFLNDIYGMEYLTHSVTRCLETDGT